MLPTFYPEELSKFRDLITDLKNTMYFEEWKNEIGKETLDLANENERSKELVMDLTKKVVEGFLNLKSSLETRESCLAQLEKSLLALGAIRQHFKSMEVTIQKQIQDDYFDISNSTVVYEGFDRITYEGYKQMSFDPRFESFISVLLTRIDKDIGELDEFDKTFDALMTIQDNLSFIKVVEFNYIDEILTNIYSNRELLLAKRLQVIEIDKNHKEANAKLLKIYSVLDMIGSELYDGIFKNSPKREQINQQPKEEPIANKVIDESVDIVVQKVINQFLNNDLFKKLVDDAIRSLV